MVEAQNTVGISYQVPDRFNNYYNHEINMYHVP